MLDAISSSQIAMDFDQLRLESINQNIANMNTPAFKRQLVEPFEKTLQTLQIKTQAPLSQTHKLTDLAISGEGYFQVQSPKGIFYTRRGDFQINAQGLLTTPTGETLLGINVKDIEHQKLDQLQVVHFKENMTYLGNGLYQTEESPIPCDDSSRVLQGFIEQSNVKSLDEMMELIKISRHFELSQRVLRTADNLLAVAINQLGENNV